MLKLHVWTRQAAMALMQGAMSATPLCSMCERSILLDGFSIAS